MAQATSRGAISMVQGGGQQPSNLEDISSGFNFDYSKWWISWFLSSKGNEYFYEVDEDYVSNYGQALDLTTDNLDDDIQDELLGALDVQARLLYGLMNLEMYKRGEFDRCPGVLCQSQSLLPVGPRDTPYEKPVKLFCSRCEDVYTLKPYDMVLSTAHALAHPFCTYSSRSMPTLSHPKNRRTREELEITENVGECGSSAAPVLKAGLYRPLIRGFQVHEIAKLQGWQKAVRDRQVGGLEALEDVP
ncbi:casein kinase II, regulatory subunit [Pisolithus albus]|nr:casein kinase II, regulatory subunit [Pisolithus albus]